MTHPPRGQQPRAAARSRFCNAAFEIGLWNDGWIGPPDDLLESAPWRNADAGCGMGISWRGGIRRDRRIDTRVKAGEGRRRLRPDGKAHIPPGNGWWTWESWLPHYAAHRTVPMRLL